MLAHSPVSKMSTADKADENGLLSNYNRTNL